MADEYPSLEIGVTGTAECLVAPENCAAAVHSGALYVFSTPSMIGLMECAAFDLAQRLLPEGLTTVGVEVNITHLEACLPGHRVVATATLERQDGKRLYFRVEARSGEVLLGEGTHSRAIITRQRFLDRLAARWGSHPVD